MSLGDRPNRRPARPGAVARGWVASAVAALATAALSAHAMADEASLRAIFVMKPDGSEVRRVASMQGFTWLGAPRWSHDGKRLAFDARNPEARHNRSFVVDLDGANLVDMGLGATLDWSPDDKQFAFAAGPVDSLKAGIWIENVDGKGRNWLSAGLAPHWSPDGSQIALTLGGPRILEVADNTQRTLFDPADKIKGTRSSFDWSPDGKRLACVFQRGEAWEVAIVSAEGAAKGVRTRLQAVAEGVAWSPDGKTLCVSLFDAATKQHRLHLFSADGDDPPLPIPGQLGDNREAAWSPDGKLLAFAGSRTDVEGPLLIPPAAPEERAIALKLLRSHDKGGTVYSLAFGPDGREALLGGDLAHRSMQVWDPDTGKVKRNIPSPGIFVAVSPDGLRAACGEFVGGTVHYIDLESGALLRQFDHQAQVISLQFSADGSRLATAGTDNNVCVFDVASGNELARIKHDRGLRQVAFSPDGKRIASTSDDKKLSLWDADSGRMVRQFEHPAVPWCVAFSPDGSKILTGTGGLLVGRWTDLEVAPEDDNRLRIWDAESGKSTREMKGHTRAISSVAFSPDGRWALSASFDRSLRLWDVETGAELARVDGKGWFTKAVFSFDGKLVLAGGGAEKDADTKRWREFPDERVRLFEITRP